MWNLERKKAFLKKMYFLTFVLHIKMHPKNTPQYWNLKKRKIWHALILTLFSSAWTLLAILLLLLFFKHWMLLCSISFFVLFTWWASNCYKGHYATTLGFFACTAYETIMLTEQGGVTQPHSEGNNYRANCQHTVRGGGEKKEGSNIATIRQYWKPQ